MNLKQNINSRTTSNMFFNELHSSQQNQNNFNTINTNLIENNKPKLGPYQILGIDKNFDEVL